MIHEQGEGMCMSTTYLLSLMLFHIDMATGAGLQRVHSPQRPLLCLALDLAAPRCVTPLDTVWSQDDGWTDI